MGNKKTSFLSVLLVVLQSCAGFTGVPQLGQVQQAQQVGCRCGNSYISCAEICHKDDGADTTEGNDALVIVLGIVAIIGTVVLASAIMPTSPRDKPSDEPSDEPGGWRPPSSSAKPSDESWYESWYDKMPSDEPNGQ